MRAQVWEPWAGEHGGPGRDRCSAEGTAKSCHPHVTAEETAAPEVELFAKQQRTPGLGQGQKGWATRGGRRDQSMLNGSEGKGLWASAGRGAGRLPGACPGAAG